MRQAGRFCGPGQPYHGLVTLRKKGKGYEWTGDFKEMPDMLGVPMRRKKPTLWFVNSMSDLFGEDVSFEFIAAVFAVMAVARWHVYQVLTKRSERMREFFTWLDERTAEYSRQFQKPWSPFDTCVYIALEYVDAELRNELSSAEPAAFPLENVWLGVSVENQHYVDRIADLGKVPAKIRFVSFEPLLDKIDLSDVLGERFCMSCKAGLFWDDGEPLADDDPKRKEFIDPDAAACPKCKGETDSRNEYEYAKIDWAIFGGESGAGSRTCDIGWIRKGMAQCRRAGVRVFVKQLGRRPMLPARFPTDEERKKIFGGNGDGPVAIIEPQALKLNDAKGGDMDEWPQHGLQDLCVREMPEVRHGC